MAIIVSHGTALHGTGDPGPEVVTLNGRHWPAWPREGGTMIDLRLFGPAGQEGAEVLGYHPQRLREAGVPDVLAEAAAESRPPGFVLVQGRSG